MATGNIPGNSVPDGSDAALSVLIADDEPDIRRLMKIVLSGDGIEIVAEADDGPAALNAFRALQSSRSPSVVILDNRMPGMSGLEVAAEILREAPGQLIILITASLDDRIRAEAKRLGIARAVTKREAVGLPKMVRALAGTGVVGQAAAPFAR
jgi:CheY-like chemotaxis protein